MKFLQTPFSVISLTCILVVGANVAVGAWAEDMAAHAHHHHAMETAAPSGPAKVSIPDAVVLDQNNRKLHFYRDLVKGKTVVIDFVFTTCTTICPPLTANFANVQKMMLERGEKNVALISVSVDPENDTPQRLKEYAAMFHAQPGWTFVTGSRSELEPIWKAFSVFSGSKQDHSPTVVIGNDSQHKWTYASGLTSASKLAAVIDSVLEKNDKATTARK
jgi:protein SCO1